MWDLHRVSSKADVSENIFNKILRNALYLFRLILSLLPLGILALKCSHNGWSNGANLWWLFVLWPTNRKWILLWHVPWGRVGFVFFFLRSRGWQSQQNSCHLLVSGAKPSADCFFLWSVSHPKATALELNQKLQVKARMIHFFVCLF